MTGFHVAAAADGYIDKTSETVLVVSPAIELAAPAGQCVIQGSMWADFTTDILDGGPQALTLRIYEGADATSAKLAEWTVQAEYGPASAPVQGCLAMGMWPVAALHPSGAGLSSHVHCITAQVVNGLVNYPYAAFVDVSGTPAGY